MHDMNKYSLLHISATGASTNEFGDISSLPI